MPINREISSLYPPFGRLVTAFLGRWNHDHPTEQAGVFEALRSFERQAELYAQGRTIPGNKVTNAPEGFSWHNYGLAVDIVFDADPRKPGMQWTWDGNMPWKKLSAMGESFGLESAAKWLSFPEYPHFQITYGLQLTEARELYDRADLQAVWNSLDLTRQVQGRKG